MERQVLYLQRKGKEKQRLLLIERHQRRALQPAFCAWKRLLAAGLPFVSSAIRQRRSSTRQRRRPSRRRRSRSA